MLIISTQRQKTLAPRVITSANPALFQSYPNPTQGSEIVTTQKLLNSQLLMNQLGSEIEMATNQNGQKVDLTFSK
jgi:hypothetical protein